MLTSLSHGNRARVRSACAAWGMLCLAAAGGVIAQAQAGAPAGDSVSQLPGPGMVMLFNGKKSDLKDNWVVRGSQKPGNWRYSRHTIYSDKNDIETKEKYSDFQLHVEFCEPNLPQKHGQAKGNSGVFLQGRYEIQVLDSYGVDPVTKGDCGAVYNQTAPLVNACKPPKQWQTYEIAFRAPRFDPASHAMTEPARVTVLLNGIAVQNDTPITGHTHLPAPANDDLSTPGPIRLQYHHDKVAFRNIWIRPLAAKGAEHYEPRNFQGGK